MAAGAAVTLTVVVGGDPVWSTASNGLTSNEEPNSGGVTLESHVAIALVEDVDKVQSTRPESQSPDSELVEVEGDIASLGCVDGTAELEKLREDAAKEIPNDYSLLFNHLELTQSEERELSSLLAEFRVATTHTPCRQGTKVDSRARSNRIEAIIGPQKVARFLSLEQNMYEYGEIKFVDCVLNNNDSSLTDTQRDKLFEIIVEIAAREEKLPGADVERRSIEYLEYQLAESNERTRLFLELAASVLTAEQVRYLFDEYQRLSYRQADSLEREKRARLDPNREPLPLHYPARSCASRK